MRSIERGVHDLRAEYIGPGTVHAGMHMEVRRGLPIEEVDDIATEVHQVVRQGTCCRFCVVYVDATEAAETGGASW